MFRYRVQVMTEANCPEWGGPRSGEYKGEIAVPAGHHSLTISPR